MTSFLLWQLSSFMHIKGNLTIHALLNHKNNISFLLWMMTTVDSCNCKSLFSEVIQPYSNWHKICVLKKNLKKKKKRKEKEKIGFFSFFPVFSTRPFYKEWPGMCNRHERPFLLCSRSMKDNFLLHTELL